MPVEFTLCDVFADRPGSGNQLAVFLDAEDLSSEAMALLVKEFGWSEVTFVVAGGSGGVPRVRIWAPYGELPFAGHPTIGTAVVLAARGRWSGSGGELELTIGRVAVEVELDSATSGRAAMQQRAPVFGVTLDDRDRVARALGLQPDDLIAELPVQFVSTGREHLMVPVRTLAALSRAKAQPEVFPPGGAAYPHRWAYVFTTETPGTASAVRSRLIGLGIEDAATGSAAGSLGAYLVRYGVHRAGILTIEQGVEMGPSSTLHVDVPVESGEIGPVTVSGGVFIWAHGALSAEYSASGTLE